MLEAYENINKKKTDKKNEEDRLAKELKEIKLQRQYLNANAASFLEKSGAGLALIPSNLRLASIKTSLSLIAF